MIQKQQIPTVSMVLAHLEKHIKVIVKNESVVVKLEEEKEKANYLTALLTS
jgi:hypothetical protein